MSPPAVQQVISAIKVILGEDGSNRGTEGTALTHFTVFIVAEVLMLVTGSQWVSY